MNPKRIHKETSRRLPRTPAQWLTEIILAIADAAGSISFGPMTGTEMSIATLFHLAPLVCLKFRGKKQQGKEARRVTEAALVNYAANSNLDGIDDHHLEQRPLIAFVLCYVTSHLALDLIDEVQANEIIEYCELHLDES
jgi:hypothetical protein